MANSDDENRLRVKLILIGNAGVGKSSLVRKYVHDDFRGDVRRTSVANTELKTVIRKGKVMEVEIWDTAGQERYDSLTGNYYRRADGCIIVYDVLKQLTFEAVHKWNRKRLEYRGSSDAMPAILVANKSDLRGSSSSGVSSELGRKAARELDVPYYEVTCTNYESVSGLFEKMLDMIIEQRQGKDLSQSRQSYSATVAKPLKGSSEKPASSQGKCC